MELHKFIINQKRRGQQFKITPIGDIHDGNKGCNLKLLDREIEKIKNNENTFTILMGDLVECIGYRDKRFSPNTISDSYNISDLEELFIIQADRMVKRLLPIKHKIIGLHTGNHEDKIREFHHFNITKYMAKKLGVKDLGQMAWTRLVFKRGTSTYTIIVHSLHGATGATTRAGVLNKLRSIAEANSNSRIILMGHTHRALADLLDPKMYLTRAGKLALHNESTLVVNTGSFLNGFTQGVTSYVEKKGLKPVDLGTVDIIITPDRNELEYSRRVRHIDLGGK